MTARMIGERVKASSGGRAGRVRGVVMHASIGTSYHVEHEDDGTEACYRAEELADGGVGRTKDEEIVLLRSLLSEVVRRAVGVHGEIVTTLEDLERARPKLIVEQRADGAWRQRFDVKHATRREQT